MFEAIVNGLSGLTAGVANLHWSNPVMIAIGCLFLFLGIKKDVEPLLLVPIGFGAILTNIPLAGLMEHEGFLRTIYEMGVANELFPLLIFIGIGAMTDFGPLLENPKIFLLGAAGQFGIFLTIGLALFSASPNWTPWPSGSSAPATARRPFMSPRSMRRICSGPFRWPPTPTCRWCRSSNPRS